MAVLPQFQFQIGTPNQYLSANQQTRLNDPYWTGGAPPAQASGPAPYRPLWNAFSPQASPQPQAPRPQAPAPMPPPIIGGGGMPSGAPRQPAQQFGTGGMGAPRNPYVPPSPQPTQTFGQIQQSYHQQPRPTGHLQQVPQMQPGSPMNFGGGYGPPPNYGPIQRPRYAPPPDPSQFQLIQGRSVPRAY